MDGKASKAQFNKWFELSALSDDDIDKSYCWEVWEAAINNHTFEDHISKQDLKRSLKMQIRAFSDLAEQSIKEEVQLQAKTYVECLQEVAEHCNIELESE